MALKQKLQVIVVAVGCTVGFTTVIIKMTGVWPCDVIENLDGALSLFC